MKLCPESIFKSLPRFVDLFGHIVKPNVTSGSYQSGFRNDPSLPMTPLLPFIINDPLSPLLRFLALMPHALSFPLFQKWVRNN